MHAHMSNLSCVSQLAHAKHVTSLRQLAHATSKMIWMLSHVKRLCRLDAVANQTGVVETDFANNVPCTALSEQRDREVCTSE